MELDLRICVPAAPPFGSHGCGYFYEGAMHRVQAYGFLILLLLPLTAQADQSRHVIVVCIDGLAAYLL